MSLGQLVVELSLDGKEFTVNLLKAEGMLANFVGKADKASASIQRAETSHRSFGRSIRESIITLGLMESAIHLVSSATLGWQKSIISVNAEVQRSIQLMKSFSTSTDKVTATKEAIADVQSMLTKASNAPFGINALTDSFVKLRVAGIDNARGALDTLTDSVAAFGGTDENLKRASVAIQQMAGKGVVSMEELRQQLGEAVPSAIQAMSDGLGVGYSKLVKDISQGKVRAGPAIQAMMDELDRMFRGKAASMMDSWSGVTLQFETSLKRVALAIGGLEGDGYSKNGYMSALTEELKRLTETINDPTIQSAAKNFGIALAQMVHAAGDGVQWIIQNREELIKWGQIILTVWAAAKGFTILRSMAMGFATLTTAMTGLTGAGGQLSGILSNVKIAMESQAQSTARAAAAAAAGGQAMTRWGAAGQALSGVLGVLSGPIGMVATMAIAGAAEWYSYGKSVDEARNKVLALKGALVDVSQLKVVTEEADRIKANLEHNRAKLNDAENGIYAGSIFGTSEKEKERMRAEIAQNEQQYRDIMRDVAAGRAKLAEDQAARQADQAVTEINKSFDSISNAYSIAKNKLHDEMSKAPGGLKDDQYNAGVEKLRKEADEKTIALIQGKIQEANDARHSLLQAAKNTTDKESIKQLADYKANEELINRLNKMLSDQRDKMRATKVDYGKDVIMPGSNDKKANSFDPFSKFVDGLSIKVAKAGAVAEDANPHLAEMQQIIQNMAIDGQVVKQSDIDRATQYAAALWEWEKSVKALKDSMKEVNDAKDRLGQIDRLIGGKLNKAENENPWLKASADAIRYQDEIEAIREKLAKAQEVAAKNSGTDESAAKKLAADAKEAEDGIAKLIDKINQLSVAAASKAMDAKSRDIRNSLKTQRQLIDDQYQYDLQMAQEYFAKNKEQLDKSQADYAAYKDYLKALDEKYARDTESGLDAWIRANQDASEKYKSLWGSAMDNFTQMLTDGLMSGKLEIGKFVEYVASEMIKIQVAKAIAGISGGLEGMFGSIGKSASSGSGNNSGGSGGVLSSVGSAVSGLFSGFTFATGGIMTEWGKASLKKYANGGVAKTPQIAVFGEGSQPEAYVPLPDGRTIPVTVSGGISMGGGGGGNVNVNVNVHEAPGTKATVTQNPDGNGGMNIDVIVEQIEGKMSQNIARGRSAVGQTLERTYGLNRGAGAVR